MGNRPAFTLYGRAHCHLCSDMAAQLEQLSVEFGLDISHVDIDSDPQLAEQFNDLVPMLVQGEREVSRYHLNIAAFRAYLAEIR